MRLSKSIFEVVLFYFRQATGLCTQTPKLLGQNPKTFSKVSAKSKDLQITFVTAFDFALALLVGFLFSPKINFVKNKNSLGGKEK